MKISYTLTVCVLVCLIGFPGGVSPARGIQLTRVAQAPPTYMRGLSVADTNHNGKPELIINVWEDPEYGNFNGARFFEYDPDSYALIKMAEIGQEVYPHGAADFDVDGKYEIVCVLPNTIQIFESLSFEEYPSTSIWTAPFSFSFWPFPSVIDGDRDEYPELIFQDYTGMFSDLYIYESIGDNTFEMRDFHGSGGYEVCAAAGGTDRDEYNNIFYAGHGGSIHCTEYIGNDQYDNTPSTNPEGGQIHQMQVGDFDRNGLGNILSGGAGIFGHSAGTGFMESSRNDFYIEKSFFPSDHDNGFGFGAVCTGDINGDGNRDIVVGGNQLHILIFDGDNRLQAVKTYDWRNLKIAPEALGVADLNGNGIDEVIVLERNQYSPHGRQSGIFEWAGIQPDPEAPGPAENLRIQGTGEVIRLYWDSPSDPDLSGFIVFRKPGTFPEFIPVWGVDYDEDESVYECEIIYTGPGNSVLISQGTGPEYFGIFSYDASLNYSGLALISRDWSTGNVPFEYVHPDRDNGIMASHTGQNSDNGPSIASASTGNAWFESSPQPEFRSGHAMVYDGNRNRTILFGGHTFNGLKNDTWINTGAGWRKLFFSDPHPASREMHALAYDSNRDVSILFGGSAFGIPMGDTWEFDGAAWQLMNTGSFAPTPRQGHTLTYDPVRHAAVLFGGENNGTLLGDLWEWDGSRWTEINPQGPIPGNRAWHATGRDDSRGVMVVFGGVSEGGLTDETWEWNGAAWTQVKPDIVPSPRSRHAMAFDPGSERIVLTGGHTGSMKKSDEYWEYDGSTWILKPNRTLPEPVLGHTMVYDSRNEALLIHGGTIRDMPDETDTRNTWRFNRSQWMEETDSREIPLPRDGHRLAYDTIRNRMVLFGGNPLLHLQPETWERTKGNWRQITGINKNPEYFVDFTMAYDPIREMTVLFGGAFNPEHSGSRETWIYDGIQWTEQGQPYPYDSLFYSAMVFEPSTGRIIRFGGTHSSDVTNFMLAWDGSWQTLNIEGAIPGERSGHAMAYDESLDRIVLFGGLRRYEFPANDTWEWDGAVWEKKTPVDPPAARFFHAMAYHPGLGQTVMFGGRTADGLTDECWTWDGVVWTLLELPGPEAREHFGMAYDPDNQCMVVFGGMGNRTILGDTWELYGETDICDTLAVTLDLPSEWYQPGHRFYCNANICNNTGSTLFDHPLFVILDIYGQLFFAPSFGPEFDNYLDAYPMFNPGFTHIEVIPEFIWPSGAGFATGIYLYAALTDPDITQIVGDWDIRTINWME